jgi:uncharacterized protein
MRYADPPQTPVCRGGFVLLASALKLLNVSTMNTGLFLLAVLIVAPLLWMVVRRRHGFPALAPRGSQDE